jgi:cell division protein FtsZ
MGMYEVDDAAKFITKSADPDAKIIFGAVIDEAMEEELKITVIATGFDDEMKRPVTMHKIEEQEREDIKRPAFAAKALEEEPEEKEIDVSAPNDEYEIPAFIRKKIK